MDVNRDLVIRLAAQADDAYQSGVPQVGDLIVKLIFFLLDRAHAKMLRAEKRAFAKRCEPGKIALSKNPEPIDLSRSPNLHLVR